MGDLKVGVIGAGIMGEMYVQCYQADPRTTVRAICNRGEERLNGVGEKFGIAGRYTDFHAMLEKEPLDLVCVATPDFAHFEPAKASLEAGKHVLCEKPFTTDLAEADALCRLVEQTGLKLQVAYSHRWLGPYHRTFEAFKNGELGEPVAAFARKNNALWIATDMINWAHKSTPSMFLSGHDIDLIRWYFDSEGVEAHGYGTKKVLTAMGKDTYDFQQAQVKFANGAYATFEAGWIYANTYPSVPDSYVQVVGTKGHVMMDRSQECSVMTTEKAYSYPKTSLYGGAFGKVAGAFRQCLESFVDCIIDDTEPHVTAHDGRQVTAVLCAIDQATRTGQTVAVE